MELGRREEGSTQEVARLFRIQDGLARVYSRILIPSSVAEFPPSTLPFICPHCGRPIRPVPGDDESLLDFREEAFPLSSGVEPTFKANVFSFDLFRAIYQNFLEGSVSREEFGEALARLSRSIWASIEDYRNLPIPRPGIDGSDTCEAFRLMGEGLKGFQEAMGLFRAYFRDGDTSWLEKGLARADEARNLLRLARARSE